MRRLLFAFLLGVALSAAAVANAAPPQILAGERLNVAAEQFVRKVTGAAEGEVRSVYRVPDRTVPSGAVLLSAHLDNTVALAPGFRGRVSVPVAIQVKGRLLQEIAVMVEVGAAAGGASMSSGPLLRGGDPIVVSLVHKGLRIEVKGTMQQTANMGDRVRVQLRDPYRIVIGRVLSGREVTVDAEP